jgi:hypothetical protein
VEVRRLPPAGEGGEEVVGRGRDALLGQVCEESLGVVAAARDRFVLALGDAVDADVDGAAAGKAAAHLFADEGARQRGDLEGTGDGVVVGEGDEVHAPTPRLPVDGARLGVGLAHQGREQPDLHRSRVARVDVQVAAHYGSILMAFASCSSRT